jgi:protein TonB
MLNKKLPKSESEEKKSISLLLGFVCALSLLFVIFEWSTEKKTVYIPIDFPVFMENVIVIPQSKEERPSAAVGFNTVENTTSTVSANIPTSEPTDEPGYFPPLPPVLIIETPEIVDFLPSEDMLKFPGNILEYLARNIRYPILDQETGISGRVICQFVIDTDGSIIDFQIVRGVSPTIDREARRVVESMPKWSPGMQRGKPVKVRYTLPIVFKLQ